MKKFRFFPVMLSLIVLFTLASCGGSHDESTYKESRSPVKVQIKQATLLDAESQFRISGLVASNNTIDLSAKVMGYIEHLNLEVGDKVAKGSLVARVKNQEINQKVNQVSSMIDQAQISLSAIEKDYNRIKRLFDQKSATQKELDDITMMKETAKAKIRQLESSKSEAGIMSAYSEIRSPISGVVTAKHKQKGEMANPGFPIITVEDQKDKIIKVYIPENYIRMVSEGAAVKYKLESESDWTTASISEMATSAQSGQYAAKIKLPRNSDYLSGMYTDVIIQTTDDMSTKNIAESSITVHKDAIISKGQLKGIFVPTAENTAIIRWVIPGRIMGDQIEILSGLNIDDKYIINADSRLMNGMPIEL